MSDKTIRVTLAERDCLELYQEGLRCGVRASGCHALLELIRKKSQTEGNDLNKWTLPMGVSHEELLLKEALLKLQGQWQYPYEHEELCHCRAITTKKVDEAILMGAHTPEKVSRQTSASTACGTCRTDVEKIIAYRLTGERK